MGVRLPGPLLHAWPTALDLADRGYMPQTGRIVLEGSSQELRQSALVRKAYLGM